MAVKIYTNEFGGTWRLWAKNDANFTAEEQKFMTGAGMRASKNPKSWFCKHDDATEAVIRNFFEGGADESHYEPIDEGTPLIDDKPKPAPASQNTAGYAISAPDGTTKDNDEPIYVFDRDTDYRLHALDAAVRAVKGLTKELGGNDIIEHYAKPFEKYLRGE